MISLPTNLMYELPETKEPYGDSCGLVIQGKKCVNTTIIIIKQTNQAKPSSMKTLIGVTTTVILVLSAVILTTAQQSILRGQSSGRMRKYIIEDKPEPLSEHLSATKTTTILNTKTISSRYNNIRPVLSSSSLSSSSLNHLSYDDFISLTMTTTHCSSPTSLEDDDNTEEFNIPMVNDIQEEESTNPNHNNNHTNINKLHLRTFLRVPLDVTISYNVRVASKEYGTNDEQLHLYESYIYS